MQAGFASGFLKTGGRVARRINRRRKTRALQSQGLAGSVLGWNPLDVVDCQCLDLRIAALQSQSQNFPDSDDE
jgi:hypothetical protein